MAKDAYAEGQHAQVESRNNTLFEEARDQIFGLGRYNLPSNPDEREQFLAGMKNAEQNPPK